MLFRIPIKPYLKKFVLKRLPEPYYSSNKEYLGVFLMKLLRDKHQQNIYDNWRDNYIGRLHVELPEHNVARKCAKNINGAVIVKFNSFLRDLFEEKMYEFIEQRIMYSNTKVLVSTAINDWIEIYDLTEDEIPYDSLRKKYMRRKQKYNKKYVEDCPIFNPDFTASKPARL